MNRLDEILVYKRREVAQRRIRLSLDLLCERITSCFDPRPFSQALRSKGGMALIAEIKRASPSAGVIRQEFEPSSLARAYEKGGARALSVLTDEHFFQGKLKYLIQARSATRLPCLLKDFIVDEYQIWEARLAEADAVLLIVAALSKKELAQFLQVVRQTGLEALVEVHTESEVNIALEAGADILGINNRDLGTFQTDLAVTERLAGKIPGDRLMVSESGIRTPDDVRRVRTCGAHAILVGESLLRQPDVASAVRKLMVCGSQ